ncbi:MAG: sulfotransferase domain-containing protein [Nocardioidaceae bacterium]|nr:sulfotransferase domain-containing protein [Nocardioidaceae bacterium]
MTANSRPLPDYLIIGTKKGGTTSLINWLIHHPHVARMFPTSQRLKSSHYFDIHYHRGPDWYRSHFPSQQARARHSRRVDGPVIVGEASPYYMFHPAAAQRARQTVPETRVIVLLRDPVSRAYSNYWDRRATGTEDMSTFEAAIDAEEQRLAGVDRERLISDPTYYSFDHDNHSYLARGRYLEHLSAWIEAFAAEQLLILQAESMFAEPEQVFATVQRFLEIPVVGTIPLAKYNERPHESMSHDMRTRLSDYYRPYNAALYQALGRDFEWEARYP